MSTTDVFLKKVANRNVERDQTQVQRFGERYIEYRKQYSAAGCHAFEPTFPLYVMFEQTYRCNLTCPSCLQGYSEAKEKYDTGVGVMPRALFEQVILECEREGCPSVAMHNIDEPLLVKDIAERIRFARDHGIMDIFMTTNAQLLTRDKARAVCDAGLTNILFSIDATSANTYRQVRVGGEFEKVLEAIEHIRRWKEEQRSELPTIRASFVTSRLNEKEEKNFLETFLPQVDYIDIQAFYAVYDLNRELVPTDHVLIDPARFCCSEPYRKIIVRANGDVVPCCSVFTYQLVMGNVYQQSIKEIFTGKAMTNLRQELREHRYNPVCRECIGTLYERAVIK